MSQVKNQTKPSHPGEKAQNKPAPPMPRPPPLTFLLPTRRHTETCGPEGPGRGPGRVGSGDVRPQQSRPPTSEDTGEARAEERAAPSTQEPGKPLASRVTDRQPQPGSGSSRLPGSVLRSRQTLKLPGQTEPRWDPSDTWTQLPLQTWELTPGLHPSTRPQYSTPSTLPPVLHSSTQPQDSTPST